MIEKDGTDWVYRFETAEGEDEREPLVLRTVWEICGTCRGEGKSSAYLGSWSMEEFQREFDPDEREDYFNGKYDRPCDDCDGSGKIRVVDVEWFEREHPDVFKEYLEDCEEEAAYQRMCRAEREMGA